MKRRIIIILLFVSALPSCLVFKCYNGRAAYKDTQREIEMSSDTLIGIGNKGATVIQSIK